MNINLLEAFRAIMQTGTISGAADTLGRSQPAISRMLDRLEIELGLSLFERRKGKVVPSREAHLLLDEIERAFVSLSSLNTFADRLREGDGGVVTIAVLPALGIDFMPEVISQFHAVHPNTRVVMNVRMSVSVENWVSTQQVDFGLAETPFHRSGFRTELFADTSYVAAIPAGHPLADREVIYPQDLNGETVVSWTSFVSARRIFDDIMQGAGVVPRPLIETTISASICSMVRRGLGIGIVDPFTAMAQRSPEVRYRPFLPSIPCHVAQLTPEMRRPTKETRDLIDCAVAERDKLLEKFFTDL
jgi:DNA-binding transcriptional LysR family regulator